MTFKDPDVGKPAKQLKKERYARMHTAGRSVYRTGYGEHPIGHSRRNIVIYCAPMPIMT